MKLAKVFSFVFLLCSLILLMGAGTQTYATTHTINVSGSGFNPSTLNVTTGDTITWNSYYYVIKSTSVPSGASAFGPSDYYANSFTYIVSVVGTYDYEDTTNGHTGSFTAAAPVVKGITLSPTSLSFGSVRVGSAKNLTATVNSVGPDAALTISSSTLSGGTNYTTSPTSTNRTINIGSSETETLTFKPTARGTLSDTLTINSDATASADKVKTIYLSGTGINGVFSGAASVAFGNVRVGKTSQQTYTITNSGDDTLFLTTPSVSGSGYSIVTNLSNLNIPPYGSGSVIIQFSPSARQIYTGSLTTTAQNSVTVPSISIGGTGIAPVISVSTANYDMGTALVGTMLSGTIQVTNTGDDALNVSSIAISNTLQGAKFSLTSGAAGFSVLPGASMDVGFTYTSSTESTDNAIIVINSDDPVSATQQVSISARSGLPKMSLDTKDTIDFGSVRVGSPATAYLTVTNPGSFNLSLQITQFFPSQFSAYAVPPTVPAQGNVQAALQFIPTAAGVVRGMAIVQGNDQTNPTDTIYFMGTGVNSALDIPASIDFHQVNLTKTRDSVLTLRNMGTAGAKILTYKLSDPNNGFILIDTAAHSISANDSVLIKIRFAPTAEQNYSATLNISTDDAVPIRQIILSGVGINSKLTTAPSSIDFGVTDTGTTVTKSFSITNTGTASTTISALTKSGDASFSLASVKLPLSIDPGYSQDISVSFSPKTAGTFNGAVVVTASEGSPLTVSLQGKGKVVIIIQAVKSVIAESGLTMTVSPDPSYSAATIRLVMDKPLDLKLNLFDASGRIVHSYDHTSFGTGEYSLPLSLEPLPSGNYYLRAVADGAIVAVTKVMIVR